MADHTGYKRSLMTLSVVMVLATVIGISSCSVVKDIIMSEIYEDRRSRSDEDHTDRHGSDSSESDETSEETYETFKPTGTYATETFDMMDVDFDYIESIYVYSIWDDAVDDNPIYNLYLKSKDTFALKGVFYFREPLRTVFEARLYKDDEVLLTRSVVLRDEVTAQADFSAGLNGFGTFEPGTYRGELVYDGQTVAYTNAIEVE